MKKVKLRYIAMLVSLALIITTINPQVVDADISSTTNMPIIYTSSIDNMQYPATSQFTAFVGYRGNGKIVITTPTIIKAYLSWDYILNSAPTIWMSQDVNGIDVIGNQITLDRTRNYEELLLDPGTYYFNYSIPEDNKNKSITVGACIVGQIANSTEKNFISSKMNPNIIKFSKSETGFLSHTSPIDYYKFTLSKRSIVTIKYNFLNLKDMQLSNARCILKNAMDGIIVERNLDLSNTKNNIIDMVLDSGTYYINMQGANTITTLRVDKVEYKVKLKVNKGYSYKAKISIDIPYEYSEIIVHRGYVPKAKVDDYTAWSTYSSEDTKEITGKSFTATKNGTYSFRVKDYLNNYGIFYVKINNIDKTAPVISGVVNGRSYKGAVVLRFSDKSSGIKSAKLNGKSIKSGYKVSRKGYYKLIVKDRANNTKTVTFRIR